MDHQPNRGSAVGSLRLRLPRRRRRAGTSQRGGGVDVVIAMISSEHGKGGIATHVSAVARELTARGVTVKVIDPSAGAPFPPLLRLSRGLRRTRLDATVRLDRRWRRFNLQRGLRRELARATPQVVYAQDPLAAYATLCARGSSRVPVAMVVHYNESQADEFVQHGLLTQGSSTERGIRRFEAMVLARLDGIVYVSEFMRRRIEHDVPVAAGVPSAVLPNFLPDVAGEPRSITDQRDCISVGSLVERKNHAYALRVLASARADGRRYTLTVVGDGVEREALVRLSTELGIADQVDFTGHRPDVHDLLRAHRVYVHSAQMDNCPYVIVEALRAGLPVVAASVGGIPEMVGTAGAGRVWDLERPEDGAAVVSRLLADEAALVEAGRLARARFDERFRADVVCGQLVEFLAGLTPVRA